MNCTETAGPRPSKTKVCNTQQEGRRFYLHVSVEMMEHLLDAPFLLWNPQSGEKRWHISEADSSFLSQNSSEGELTWTSLKAAQGRAANTELLYTTVYKKDSKERGKQSLGRNRDLGRSSCREESNPSRNYDSFMPQRRTLHPRQGWETGTVIMA